ncbi:hypothetical protein SAMN05519104_6327 [Rhizobiales bacterium GAS188]|nr:hypothetical protein SAMN05519104_6327 [Rhizobiales bacterium GAS188]
MERSLIRPFEPSDLPEVAIMFLKAFRGRTAAAPTSLIEHMRDVYFGHPAYDRRMGSLVHLRLDGAIDGFIGAFPQPLMLSGRALRGVVTGGFMVDDPAANPITGARLVRRLLNGPQDVTITDTANRRSLDFQRVLGCETLDLQSLQWTKILEPASYVLSLLDVRTGRLPMMPLRPLARLLDRVRVEKAQYHPIQARSGWRDADIDVESFASIFERFAGEFDLRPSWTRSELLWLLDQASRKTKFGSLFIRGVQRCTGETVGAYLYFGRRRSEAMTLQIAARPEAAEVVLESLFAHAAAMGCTVVRGTAQPFLMPGLFRNDRIVFRHASGTHLHARDADLLRIIRSGRVLVGGLVGEGWTRLVSDEFAEDGPKGKIGGKIAGKLARACEMALWPSRRAPVKRPL